MSLLGVRIRRFGDWFRNSVPTSSLYVFYAFSFLLPFMGWLSTNIFSTPCNILACQYQASLIPLLNLAYAITFLPLTLYLVAISGVSPPVPWLVFALGLLSIFYLAGASYLVGIGVDKLRGKSSKGRLTKARKYAALGNIGVFSIFMFLLYFTAITFLSYPTIQLNVDYMNFIEVASLIVIIVTLYSVREVGVTTNRPAYLMLLGVGFYTIIILNLGALGEFIFDARVLTTPDTVLDVVSNESF